MSRNSPNTLRWCHTRWRDHCIHTEDSFLQTKSLRPGRTQKYSTEETESPVKHNNSQLSNEDEAGVSPHTKSLNIPTDTHTVPHLERSFHLLKTQSSAWREKTQIDLTTNTCFNKMTNNRLWCCTSLTWAIPQRCPPARLEPWAQPRQPVLSLTHLSEPCVRCERLWRCSAGPAVRRAADGERSTSLESTASVSSSDRYPDKPTESKLFKTHPLALLSSSDSFHIHVLHTSSVLK